MTHEAGLAVQETVDNFGVFVSEVDRVLALSIAAIRQLRGTGELVAKMHDPVWRARWSLEPASPEEEKHVEIAESMEAAALQEMADGFPLLIAHSVVALWSALESTIPRFVARSIAACPEVLQTKPFEKLKLPAALFGSDPVDFATEVVADLDRNTASSLKPGVGRFEELLAAIGLNGTPNDEMRRNLYELSKVRNLVVHQFSIVDARFLEGCPWIKSPVGMRLKLSRDDYDRYRDAAGG